MNSAAETVRPAHCVELADGWSLWRDFAVRSSGFPVEGLEAFGPGEDERLAEVARDPAFREALAWQSRESLSRAVDKLAAGAPGSPSRRRRWADVVGSYWQRYCSKNDTIGFFGPLAWGSFADATAVRAGALERERVVHFETWAMEAVGGTAAAHDPLPRARALPAARRGSTGWRPPARRSPRRGARTSATPSIGWTACSRRSPAGLPRAAEGDSGGGRTIAYLDCMRDLDVTLGPAVLDELRTSLPGRAARVALVVRPRVRPRAPICSSASHTGARGRSRRCSAS